jgi:pyruvate/2-oxoglutarate dehydrogenase complex dihydrolipoamide acyltransferase (E2) component
MPRIDANVDEGAIGRWLAEVGEAVPAGGPLVEIITDKATFELEAERSGILRRRVAPTRSVVPVGYVIALLSERPEEALPDVSNENEALMDAYRERLLGVGADAGPGGPEHSAASAAGGVRATPAARRLAAREGLSVEVIAERTGGVVRQRDVERELERGREGDN